MLPKHLSVKYDSLQYLWWLGNTQSNGKSKEFQSIRCGYTYFLSNKWITLKTPIKWFELYKEVLYKFKRYFSLLLKILCYIFMQIGAMICNVMKTKDF